MAPKKRTGGPRRTYDVPRTEPPQRPKTQEPTSRTGKKRRRRVKRKVKLVTFFFLFAVVVTFVILSLTVLFRIENFEITGDVSYTQEQILTAAGIPQGDNLFLTDRDTAEQKLEETLPYISNAEIKIVLPNTLKFQLTPGTATLLLKNSGGAFLLDENGKALQTVSEDYPRDGLLLVEDLAVQSAEVGKPVEFEKPQAMEILREVCVAVEKNSLEKVRSIKFSEGLAVTLNYDDRVDILLGAAVNLDSKITNAKLLLMQYVAADEKGTLDFSIDENRPIFDPWYDTPSIQVPPAGSTDSKPADNTASDASNTTTDAQ